MDLFILLNAHLHFTMRRESLLTKGCGLIYFFERQGHASPSRRSGVPYYFY